MTQPESNEADLDCTGHCVKRTGLLQTTQSSPQKAEPSAIWQARHNLLERIGQQRLPLYA